MAASGGGEVVVPPTIQALLAARLDQLDASERGVLERGAVEGRIFHRGAVQALAPEEPQLMTRLTSLVRKELVRPDTTQLPGDDAFRFRHLLIRDAAYDALPEATRAQMHELFADWLAEHGRDLVELDEILGYHLEQACRYRAELGLSVTDRWPRRRGSALTSRGPPRTAPTRLSRRGQPAQTGRSLSLPDRMEIILELDLVERSLLRRTGRGRLPYRRRHRRERAATAGDRAGELCARIRQGIGPSLVAPEGATEQLTAFVDEALPVFEAADDDFGLFLSHYALSQVAHMRSKMDTALEALEQAVAMLSGSACRTSRRPSGWTWRVAPVRQHAGI